MFREISLLFLRLPLIGSIDQFGDSTDLLSNPKIYHRLKTTYKIN